MNKYSENSRKILDTTKETILSFFEIYKEIKVEENAKQQDLLRAIILFSCSGIDAVIKQLINDTLEEIIKKDEGAQSYFKNYIEKKIKNNNDVYNSKLLSEIFISDEKPKDTLIRILKRELMANSLQSAEELSRVAAYFNIETTDIDKIKEVFVVRNQITHEMDIDMSSEVIIRRNRNKEDIKEYSDRIIKLAEHYIKSIENKLELD